MGFKNLGKEFLVRMIVTEVSNSDYGPKATLFPITKAYENCNFFGSDSIDLPMHSDGSIFGAIPAEKNTLPSATKLDDKLLAIRDALKVNTLPVLTPALRNEILATEFGKGWNDLPTSTFCAVDAAWAHARKMLGEEKGTTVLPTPPMPPENSRTQPAMPL